MNKEITKLNYELQKAHSGSTETVKLSFYHVPYRLFLAFAFIFDIITDIIVIIELWDNDIKESKIVLLVFFCLAFFGMIVMNCGNMRSTAYPKNGFLRLLFALFSVFGLDSIIYFIYSGLTLQGHTMHDYKINGPKSPRKLWGAWQSVLSSFITAHYIFYWNKSSSWAVVSLFTSMINARLNMNMDHTNKTFLDLLKNDIFCMRFFSTFFEIWGRPLFFAATTIIVINNSSFLSSSRKPFRLTYEFFAWDGIALGSACMLFLIIYQLYFKQLKISLSLMIQNFIGAALIRPAIDKNDLNSVKLASKMVIFIDDKTTIPKHLKRQIQLGLGFPCLWRLGEYIALNIVIYDYEFMQLVEKRDKDILYLAYMALIVNGINTAILLYSVFILIIVEPKFDGTLGTGHQTSNQIGNHREEVELKINPNLHGTSDQINNRNESRGSSESNQNGYKYRAKYSDDLKDIIQEVK